MKKLIALILISIIFSGLQAVARPVSEGRFIKDINVLFLKEDYSGLLAYSREGMRSCRLDRNQKKEVFYLMGLSYLQLKKFDKARESFNDILKMKGNDLREEAYIGIADSYFKESDFNKAIAAYEGVINAFPRSDRISGVYSNIGLCYKAKNNFDKANYYRRKIQTGYNESFEAKESYLSSNGTKYYIIQIGAFKSLKNANRLHRNAAKKGYESYIQKSKSGGETIYKVRAGKFSNKDYAYNIVRKLKRDKFSVKIIVE